jgi:hypothetical protein
LHSDAGGGQVKNKYIQNKHAAVFTSSPRTISPRPEAVTAHQPSHRHT